MEFSKPLHFIPSSEPVFLLFYTKIKLPAAGGGAAGESSLAECRAGCREGQLRVGLLPLMENNCSDMKRLQKLERLLLSFGL